MDEIAIIYWSKFLYLPMFFFFWSVGLRGTVTLASIKFYCLMINIILLRYL
jgi:hypothetical protein